MLHNIAAAAPPLAAVPLALDPKATAGDASHVRLLGHGHGGTVDQRTKTNGWPALIGDSFVVVHV